MPAMDHTHAESGSFAAIGGHGIFLDRFPDHCVIHLDGGKGSRPCIFARQISLDGMKEEGLMAGLPVLPQSESFPL
jgi:hypothetical protein